MADKKKIYIHSVGLHTYFKGLVANLPESYDYIIDVDDKRFNTITNLRKNKILAFIYKNIIKKIVNPFKIVKKVYQKKSPEETDYIFSFVLVNENKPRVIEIIDNPMLLAGYDYKVFIKNLPEIEKQLSSEYCKSIIIHTEDCRKMFKKYFSNKVLNKLELIPPGIKYQDFKKTQTNKKEINFLFVGSRNNPGDFFIKGGLETLESFTQLTKKYDNIKLTMVCEPPADIKEKYNSDKIIYLGESVPYEKMKDIYLNSDIFILPGHTFFIMAFLEAMSFGLPIIALDTFASSGYIDNNQNGFLIKPSKNIPYNVPEYPVNIRTNEFFNAIRDIDQKVIDRICDKSELLINNPALRRKMGQASLNLARTKFSIEKRKQKLKKIFNSI